jgi:GT2 family glycosyltransferase
MGRTLVGEGTPQISVVISTLGNYAVLARVLEGFAHQDATAGSFEVVVVTDRNDPDPDAVERAMQERPYPVRRITGRVPGLSANRNAGWREARAPLVLFTDNDTLPSRSLVSEHLAWHRDNPAPEVAVAGSIVWARELKLTPFMRWLDEGIQFNREGIAGDEAGWGHLYGANSSVKRAFIERVGDWDEVRLPYLYDDVDWAYRASKHGMRVLYNHGAEVEHLRYDATLEFWKKKMRRLAQTERQFCSIHPEIDPWFYGMFTSALSVPAARSRGATLTRFVPRWVPVIGKRAWDSAGQYWRQQLAPHFLQAWDESAPADGDEVQRELQAFFAPPPSA